MDRFPLIKDINSLNRKKKKEPTIGTPDELPKKSRKKILLPA